MKKEHPYANLLRAIADGHKMQWLDSGNNWVTAISTKQILVDIGCGTALSPLEYRIKPRTININGHEVPEPMLVEPSDDENYFVPNLIEDHTFIPFTWIGDGLDKKWLALGICHTTKEAAIAHAKALFSFTDNQK